jgi:hypothetical protein
MDPDLNADSDPSIFIIDLQDASIPQQKTNKKKVFLHITF